MKGLLNSLRYALQGLRSALKTERNLRIHIFATLVAIILGIYLKLSMIKWGILILVIGSVIVAELFNTAMERMGDDAANGNQKKLIKQAKDTAAAGVFIAVIVSLIIGVMFLIIPFIQSFL